MKSRLVCPKCKSKTLTLINHIECYTEYIQEDGNLDIENGNNREGDYFKLIAVCECGKTWTVRNIIDPSNLEE